MTGNYHTNYLSSLIEPNLSAKKDREPLHKLFSYPAKFQSYLPKALISSLTTKGDLVVDPFSGGGTSSAEAFLQGRNSFAMDLNPIAILISKAKTSTISAKDYLGLENDIMKLLKKNKTSFLNKEEKHLMGPSLSSFVDSGIWLLNKHQNKSTSYILATTIIKRVKLSTRRDKEHLRTASFDEHKKYILKEIDRVREFLVKENISHKASNRVEFGSNHDMAIKSNSADLIITSPPYPGVDVEYNLIQLQRRDLKRCYRSDLAQRIAELIIKNKKSPVKKNLCLGGIDSDDYWQNSYLSLKEVNRVLKPHRLCFLYIGFKSNEEKEHYESLIEKAGLELIDWHRVNLGKERVASSRGLHHGRETKMMKSDGLYVLRKING